MNNLLHILTRGEMHFDEIIYTLFCKNDMFYVGHTINLVSRLKYGHFGKFSNRAEFLKINPPLEVLFIVKTGVNPYDLSIVHRIEDYVTIVVSKKYGAENVFGGFRHVKSPAERVKFVKNYDYSANKDIVDLIDSKIDFELPDIMEIREAVFGINNRIGAN